MVGSSSDKTCQVFILVMDRGQIVERGTPEGLLALGNPLNEIFFILIYVDSPTPALLSANLHPPKKGKSQLFLYPGTQIAC